MNPANLRRKVLLIAVLLLSSHIVNAQSSHSNVFKSVRAEHDADLTLDPAAAFWASAEPSYMTTDNNGRPLSAYKTKILSRWTDTYLYVLFVCPYEQLYLKPNPLVDTETYQLWNWDVAELFIGTDFQNIKLYKEFEISPQGEWIDLDVDLRLPHHEVGWTWNSGFNVSARIDRGRKIWYGAMRIPFSSIDHRKPAVGNIFRANLFRSQGPPGRQISLAWQPTMGSTFHIPERFGTLALVGDRSRTSK